MGRKKIRLVSLNVIFGVENKNFLPFLFLSKTFLSLKLNLWILKAVYIVFLSFLVEKVLLLNAVIAMREFARELKIAVFTRLSEICTHFQYSK